MEPGLLEQAAEAIEAVVAGKGGRKKPRARRHAYEGPSKRPLPRSAVRKAAQKGHA